MSTLRLKNANSDGGSTALKTAYTVDTVDHLDMVYTVDAVDTVYTVDTAYIVDTAYTVYDIETAYIIYIIARMPIYIL